MVHYHLRDAIPPLFGSLEGIDIQDRQVWETIEDEAGSFGDSPGSDRLIMSNPSFVVMDAGFGGSTPLERRYWTAKMAWVLGWKGCGWNEGCEERSIDDG